MKLLHHFLASAVCVTILAASSTPISALAVDMRYLRSTSNNDVPALPSGENESDDDSELFAGSTDSADSSEIASVFSVEETDDSSEVVPDADAELNLDSFDEVRRLGASTPKSTTAVPKTTTPKSTTAVPKATMSPKATTTKNTTAPASSSKTPETPETPETPKSTNSTAPPTKPANTTAVSTPSKPTNATTLPTTTPKSMPTNVPPTKAPTTAK
ncbi:Putative RxLR effector [Phytophthora palmivora]|uniref:RxLR effector n=1 Tax=Phytophthora palmivora TaxID=4796 RepID=A0A2P4YDG9_9STRA|nr:Putative RxLR effector [Phytophthora palmivora]